MAEFPSEKAKVSCRVCGKVMLSKNYTKHLTDFHKSENASNKRGKDQMSLVDFFSSNDGPSPSRKNKTTSEHNVRDDDPPSKKKSDSTAIRDVVSESEMDIENNKENYTDTGDGETSKRSETVIHRTNTNTENHNSEKNESLSTVFVEAVTVSEGSVSKGDNKEETAAVKRVTRKFNELKLAVSDLQKDVSASIEVWSQSEGKSKHNDDLEENTGTENEKDSLIIAKMEECRDVIALVEAFPLLYNRLKEIMICHECVNTSDIDNADITTIKGKSKKGVFTYVEDMEGKSILTQSFRNLKKNVRAYLLSENHKKEVQLNKEKEKEDPTSDSERAIGMRIGRVCYYLFKRGKPYAEFEQLLLLHNLNNVKIGNLNHSIQFPRKFLPFVAGEVKKIRLIS